MNRNSMEQDNMEDNSITITIPQGIDGPQNIDQWFNSEGVLNAKSFMFKKRSQGNQAEADDAQNFYYFVKRGYKDKCCGDGPTLKKLKESGRNNKETVKNITEYLMLSNDGTSHHEGPPDLGNEGLNMLAAQIHQLGVRMDAKFDDVYKRFDDVDKKFDDVYKRFDDVDKKFDDVYKRFDDVDKKFDDVYKRFDDSDKRNTSVQSWISNRYRGKGSSVESGNHYREVANGENKYPSDNHMEELRSVEQINHYNGDTINEYLRFYDLSISGTVSERKQRLMRVIGISEIPNVVFGGEV